MKVKIGKSCCRLPTIRVGLLKHFSITDLKRLRKYASLDEIRDWIPEAYADNLFCDLLASDSEKGSVFIVDYSGMLLGVKERDLPEEYSVVSEPSLYAVTYVCAGYFSVLDSMSLNRQSVEAFLSRHPKLVNLTPWYCN